MGNTRKKKKQKKKKSSILNTVKLKLGIIKTLLFPLNLSATKEKIGCIQILYLTRVADFLSEFSGRFLLSISVSLKRKSINNC